MISVHWFFVFSNEFYQTENLKTLLIFFKRLKFNRNIDEINVEWLNTSPIIPSKMW